MLEKLFLTGEKNPGADGSYQKQNPQNGCNYSSASELFLGKRRGFTVRGRRDGRLRRSGADYLTGNIVLEIRRKGGKIRLGRDIGHGVWQSRVGVLVILGHFNYQVSAVFHTKTLKTVISTPSIEKSNVGVKFPVIGTGASEGVGTGSGVKVASGVTVGVASGVATGVAPGARVWEGVASKAGPSLAWTIKFLVRDLVIPVVSFQVMVME